MIQATEADIGRRVVYDARPAIKERSRGVVAGVDGRDVLVRFDHGGSPLRVFSNLHWDDRR